MRHIISFFLAITFLTSCGIFNNQEQFTAPHINITPEQITIGKVIVSGNWKDTGLPVTDISTCFPIGRDKSTLYLMSVYHSHGDIANPIATVTLYQKSEKMSDPKPATTVLANEEHDIRLLSIEYDKPVMLLQLSDKDPEYGKEVICFGCQLGHDPILTYGYTSGPIGKFYIVTAPTIGGGSGGPVIYKGTNIVVGMTQRVRVYQGIVLTHVQFIITSRKMKGLLDV